MMHSRRLTVSVPQRLISTLTLIGLVLSMAVSVGQPRVARAATFTVTKTADTNDGTCDSDCSLREAIVAANDVAGPDTITFAIGPVGSVQTIRPQDSGGGVALPVIRNEVLLDGWSQGGPGYTGPPLIEIDGTNAFDPSPGGLGTFGFNIQASNSQVRGFAINRFPNVNGNGFGIGVFEPPMSDVSNVWIYGNHIGTDPTGTIARPNGQGGIWLGVNSASTRVGTNADGVNDAAERNVISGNNGNGVYINTLNNVIAGNYIGVAADGSSDLGNSGNGLLMVAGSNTIGGTAVGAGNVISGNGGRGIHLNGTDPGTNADNNTILGNYIGLNAAGSAALGNSLAGIRIDDGSNNTIGGTTTAARNVISANQFWGVRISGPDAQSNSVKGNYVGTAADGTTPLVNAQGGVLVEVDAKNNIIGGTEAGAGNVISSNAGAGVAIGTGGGAVTGNAVLSNSISNNTGLGIDISNNGVTTNDVGDGDGGPNLGQNFPVVISAAPGSGTTIHGRLNSTANTEFRIEFFANSSCDPSGFGEGQTFLGSTNATTDASGNTTFTYAAASAVPENHAITANAIDPAGNTSEFSRCTLVSAANDSWPDALPLTLAAPNPLDPSITQASVSQYIYKDGQSKWYKFSVQPGSRLDINLTNLPANYDLTLYKDIGSAFKKLTTPEDLLHLMAEFPTRVSPLSGSPGVSPLSGSPGVSPLSGSPGVSPDAVSPDTLNPDALTSDAFSPGAFSPGSFDPAILLANPTAFASAQTRSLIGVSALDGLASEEITGRTWESSGDFYVRVRGRNGASSLAAPFQLQVTQVGGACAPVVPVTTSSTITADDGGYKTIILTDLGRMEGTDAEIDALWSKLATFAARTEVAGKVVNVGEYTRLSLLGDARVRAANAQADANPDCPTGKNYAASAIKEIVDRYHEENLGLEYVVIVGSDHVIPFFRHADRAELATENLFVPPVRDTTTSQSSLRLGYVLSQDDYGSQVDISLGANSFPIPDLAVGRLVETASEATGMLDAYLATSGGVVNQPVANEPPTAPSTLVTGYDFLSDAAEGIQRELRLGAGDGTSATRSLIQPGDKMPSDPTAWTADDLRRDLLGSRHDLVFLAGHFSDGRALAADYSTRLTTEEVAASTVDLKNAIIFSAGCHSGYNTVDSHRVPDASYELDWAQAFARKGATLLAGTGYQYGDYILLEYGERLYSEFAKQFRQGTGPVPVGKALVAAKQTYLSNTSELVGIHEKTVLQTTLFGLPMLSVNMPNRIAAPDDGSGLTATGYTTNPGSTLGLKHAEITVTSDPQTVPVDLVDLSDPDNPVPVTATYLKGAGGVVATPYEPILPLEARNVKVRDAVLRGVGFREGTYTEAPDQRPLISLPVTELRGTYTPFESDVLYPIRPWNVNYFDALADPTNGATRLTVTPAQYISSAPGSATSTERRFSDMRFRLFYSNNIQTYGANTPALAAPPAISNVSSVVVPATATVPSHIKFSVAVTGDPSAGIQEVWITYTDPTLAIDGNRAFQSLDLVQNTAESTLWEAMLPVGSSRPENIRYMVQAVNGVGLVTLNTNQGMYYMPGPDTTMEPSNPAATTLTLGSPAASAPFGEQRTFQAVLTSAGAPLNGKTVSFGLGLMRAQAVTDADGRAAVTLPLLQLPGDYELKVSFTQTAQYITSSASSPFKITKQGTKLTLTTPSTAPQYGDESGVMATLKDNRDQPLLGLPVVFYVSGNGRSYTKVMDTDYLGRARLDLIPLPAGTYSVNACFAGPTTACGQAVMLTDNLYDKSTAPGTLTVAAEDTTAVYTGDTLISFGSSLRLAATVTQTADGAPGDLTRAEVEYVVKNSNGFSEAVIGQVAADGTSSATIAGLATGVYQIEARVVGGFFSSPIFSTLLAVYDPSAGFVTGGGWINSPAGAYPTDPALTGRANFGFVSKYEKGAKVPTGQTEFQFKVASLNFHSVTYEWLVVAGARAQYKGSGTINGTGNYGFMLTAIDGQVAGGGGTDKFRMKIWDKNNGDVVVYDNQSGAGDEATPSTAIDGGSIMIHSK